MVLPHTHTPADPNWLDSHGTGLVRLCQRLLADHITRSAKLMRADTGTSDADNDPILLNLQPTSSISVYIEGTNSRRNQVGSYLQAPGSIVAVDGAAGAAGGGESGGGQAQEQGQGQGTGHGMYTYVHIEYMLLLPTLTRSNPPPPHTHRNALSSRLWHRAWSHAGSFCRADAVPAAVIERYVLIFTSFYLFPFFSSCSADAKVHHLVSVSCVR